MSSAASRNALREQLEERFSLLANDLERICQAHSDAAASQARELARRQLADHLNQSVRRLRQAEGFQQISATLADAGSAFCNVAAVFSVTSGEVAGVAVCGLRPEDAAARFPALRFAVSRAAAFAGVLETRDPVTALCSPAELSAELAALFGHAPDDRVCLFPVTVDQDVRAVLYAFGELQAAPLELLAQAASGALEVQARRIPAGRQEPEPEELVRILPAPVRSAKPGWEDLSPQEQQIHLRAQRFARVQVAEMRLHHSEGVRGGRSRADLYGELRAAIDAARSAYRELFLGTCPSMVDYLHLELLSTLAHNDEALLGKDYPGPLV
ncbi:MAG TPA: hypothetical protein VFA33_21150 [Bryobacteraceae bacterium]|nr:hypothetical protein [Bryobacteraceae bacterium]